MADTTPEQTLRETVTTAIEDYAKAKAGEASESYKNDFKTLTSKDYDTLSDDEKSKLTGLAGDARDRITELEESATGEHAAAIRDEIETALSACGVGGSVRAADAKPKIKRARITLTDADKNKILKAMPSGKKEISRGDIASKTKFESNVLDKAFKELKEAKAIKSNGKVGIKGRWIKLKNSI